jgi:hypothetical protein
MRRTHDLLATIGEYTDRKTGEKKKRRIKIGCMFLDDRGHQVLHFDVVPVGPEWSGWVGVFEIREQEQKRDDDDIAY